MNAIVSPQPATFRPMTLFSFLVALALLIELGHDLYLVFDPSSWIESYHFPKTMVACAAIVLLLRPSSRPRLIAFCLLFLFNAFILLPRVPNHWFFTTFVCSGILVSYAALAVRHRTARVDPQALFRYVAPLAVALLAVLYFWAVVHKLNLDFFDPEISCATLQYFKIKNRVPWIPVPQNIHFGIYFTLLIETLIPLLLVFRRTAVWGVLLGVLFHLPLGINYAGFTALLFAVFSLCLPVAAVERGWAGVARRLPTVPGRRLLAHPIMRLVGTVLAVIVVAFLIGQRGPDYPRHADLLYFTLGALSVAAVLWVLAQRLQPLRSPIRLPHPALAVVPLLLFAVGLMPHLGVKNTQSFAMFSNLRTEEGRSNHFFIPSEIQLSGNLDDYVAIESSSDRILDKFSRARRSVAWNSTYVATTRPYREHRGQEATRWKFRLPYRALQNRVTELRLNGTEDVELTYWHDGKLVQLDAAEDDPRLSRASLLQRKLLLLRGLPETEQGLCMW